MKLSVPAESYDSCRQLSLSIAADLAVEFARLTAEKKTHNFFSEGLALLRGDLIDTAALMIKSAALADKDTYTIELPHYAQIVERITGITGLVIICLDVLPGESFQRLAGKLLDLIAKLHNLQLATA